MSSVVFEGVAKRASSALGMLNHWLDCRNPVCLFAVRFSCFLLLTTDFLSQHVFTCVIESNNRVWTQFLVVTSSEKL